jgi:energy-coupling factor transport system permease protein
MNRNTVLNDLALFILTFCYTLMVLFARDWSTCLFWLVLSLLQLQLSGSVRWKYIFYFILLLAIPSISLFVTSYIHLKEEITGLPLCIMGLELDQYRFDMSLYLTIRSGVLSLISFSFLTAIRYDQLIYSLIQNLGFPVRWGYALLVAFNSVSKLREEFIRIQQAALLRFSRKPLFYFYIIPLLVSATRYSQQAAMSIQTRGLSQDKSFIIKVKMRITDIAYLFINIAGMIIISLIIN